MSESLKIYGRALDPIHIGAGGYRLGRVDNTIVRDPATDVPKIPGSSIAGMMRAFYEMKKRENEAGNENLLNPEELFGAKNDKKGSLRFYDGQIIFFPVSSIQGTVWITTKELLEYWMKKECGNGSNKEIKIPEEMSENKAYRVIGEFKSLLNLGWLFLEVENTSNGGKSTFLPSEIKDWVKKAVIVSDKLFSHIINDNLEVRTSVRIDPETGTAKDGALFTYEAIPRGTVLGFEISSDDKDKNEIKGIVNKVQPYFKLLGIGGMGTRGFGRLEIKQISTGSGGKENDQS